MTALPERCYATHRGRRADGKKEPLTLAARGQFHCYQCAPWIRRSPYGEYRTNQELASRAAGSLRAELEYTLSVVEPYVPYHRAHVAALQKVDAAASCESGYQAFTRVRPPLPSGALADVPILRRAAWDAASSSGAMRLIDYDLIARLSEIYQFQDHLRDAIQRIPISSATFFDPASGPASVRVCQAALTEVAWAEQVLVDLYRKQLLDFSTSATPQ